MTSAIDLYSQSGGGVTRSNRQAARAIGRSKSVSQIRRARVIDEVDVALEKLEQSTYLTVNAAMALTKVSGVAKQLEEQAGGDMALAARLQRLSDRHEWICGDMIEDFRRDVSRK